MKRHSKAHKRRVTVSGAKLQMALSEDVERERQRVAEEARKLKASKRRDTQLHAQNLQQQVTAASPRTDASCCLNDSKRRRPRPFAASGSLRASFQGKHSENLSLWERICVKISFSVSQRATTR